MAVGPTVDESTGILETGDLDCVVGGGCKAGCEMYLD